jgi:hypothetical protein
VEDAKLRENRSEAEEAEETTGTAIATPTPIAEAMVEGGSSSTSSTSSSSSPSSSLIDASKVITSCQLDSLEGLGWDEEWGWGGHDAAHRATQNAERQARMRVRQAQQEADAAELVKDWSVLC